MMRLVLISFIFLHHYCNAQTVPEYLTIHTEASQRSSSSENVAYDCILLNLWTSDRHPKDFPGDPHWSPPVYASHNKKYTMFEEGKKASKGVESVAETGSTTKINKEIKKAKKKKKVLHSQIGSGFLGGSLFPSSITSGIKMDPSHPYISMMTMIAPSPDWFTGMNDFDMRDGESGKWFSDVILDLFPWDSGTDSGTTYESNDKDVDESIFQLTINTIPDTKVFASPDMSTVLPVARINCKIDE